ncbi:bunched [Carabus blaptoides fortunei]
MSSVKSNISFERSLSAGCVSGLKADLHRHISLTLSAAGNSAVAIDNKIEQAMDLVKSHLMFAVREEVEVLKEKIAELMDRINQLETENSILKANATQETLAQLTMPQDTLMMMPPPVVVSAGTAVATAVASAAANVLQNNNPQIPVQSNVSPGSGPTTGSS